MADAWHEFLGKIGLLKYKALLNGQGFDDEHDLFVFDSNDLDSVHIMETCERNLILDAVAKIEITSWLRYHNLLDYEKQFRKIGIHTLGDLKKCTMCDDMMDDLEVMVPGHRKRLTMAANHICVPVTSQEQSSMSKEPAAYGYWAKNDATPTSNTDFLWLKNCKMKSIPGHDPTELVNCLVDTGSEVVTIDENIMAKLDVRFIQTIKSRGIHKEEEKPLYRGVLMMGTKEIEVDVMPDSYNSVGCNVFQQFSHAIDGRNHSWFYS